MRKDQETCGCFAVLRIEPGTINENLKPRPGQACSFAEFSSQKSIRWSAKHPQGERIPDPSHCKISIGCCQGGVRRFGVPYGACRTHPSNPGTLPHSLRAFSVFFVVNLYSTITRVPEGTRSWSTLTSSLCIRTQPRETGSPSRSGSSVPWIPNPGRFQPSQ